MVSPLRSGRRSRVTTGARSQFLHGTPPEALHAESASPHAAGALAPIFATMSAGLHLLVAGLGVLVVVRALEGDAVSPGAAVVLTCLFEALYFAGVPLRARFERRAADPRGTRGMRAGLLWLSGLAVLWAVLVALAADAAFLVFPLFFLCLHLLPGGWGPVAVLVSALVSVGALAAHRGLTVGGVTGPLVGAAAAIVIGLGYRALFREVHERQRLLDELLAAQSQLAESQRRSGIEAERTRMAAELHDTVAQGLSSIRLLLSAAERRMDVAAAPHAAAAQAGTQEEARPAPPSGDGSEPRPELRPESRPDPRPESRSAAPGREEIALAKQTAAESLAETRAFIRALASPALAVRALPAALERLCASADATARAQVLFRTDGTPRELARAAETTLLRIVQGALGNAVAHAEAARIVVTLTYLSRGAAVDVVDDGIGFDPAAVRVPAESGSFGLGMMRQRAEEAGGRLEVESRPGAGTAVSAVFEDMPTTEADGAATEAGEGAAEAGEVAAGACDRTARPTDGRRSA
ncbi:sensor histidine kinase [Brevibacterium salitolerans]|uniref:Sensor histidine kinase n=1 Tax=Brevibacterium salitolerans TaxID=1403566 RepID=A0ABN2WWL9_9MICO